MRISLPTDCDDLPKLSSPLFIHGYRGARSFYFIPVSRDSGMKTHRRLRDHSDKDGRVVEVYENTEDPKLWWLRWRLSNGYLYTFLNEEDGLAMIPVELRALSIAEDRRSGTPFLLPESL